jgi:hypothetical protein
MRYRAFPDSRRAKASLMWLIGKCSVRGAMLCRAAKWSIVSIATGEPVGEPENQPAPSRLENGHTPNPTLDSLRRYAAAMGKRLVLTAEDVAEIRARGADGWRAAAKKMAGRKKRTV